MSIYLLDEQPIVVDKVLADTIGLEKAYIITRIHQWVYYNKKHKKNYEAGFYWTYGSMKEWYDKYFLSLGGLSKVKTLFKNLRDEGYLVVGRFNKVGFDKTNWYRINYEKIDELKNKISKGDKVVKNINRLVENQPMERSDVNHSDWSEINQPIPVNKTVNNNSINISSHSKKNIIYSEGENNSDGKNDGNKDIGLGREKRPNRQYFRDSFGYSRVSKNNKQRQKELDKWIDYAVQVCLMHPDTRLSIGRISTTAGEFQKRLIRLRYEHINYVFDLISTIDYPANHKSYMLAILYNAEEQYESSLLFKGGNFTNKKNGNKTVIPTSSHMQERIANINKDKKSERVVTADDEMEFDNFMKMINKSDKGKERKDG